MNNKRFIYRASNLVITLAVIAILILLNVFVRDASWKIDFTEAREYTLTSETKDYIKGLDKEINLLILDSKEDLYGIKTEIEKVKRIANLYAKLNSKIKVETIDIEKHPRELEKYMKKDNTLYPGSVVVSCGDNWDKINVFTMFKSYSDGNVSQEVESKITNVINKVYLGKMSTIYYLEGHGEITSNPNIVAYMKQYLNDITYELKGLSLIAQSSVPEDASSIAIMGPINDITEGEKDIIMTYLKNGGSLMLMVDPSIIDREKYNNIKDILKEYNLALDEDFVCEDKEYCVQGYPALILPKLVRNPVTQGIYNNGLYVFMEGARSISVIDKDRKDVNILPILMTSSGSWGDVDYDSVAEPKKDDIDKRGPLSVAAIAQKKEDGEDKYSKVMVYGNSSFANFVSRYQAPGNWRIFTESVKWIDSEDLPLINVQPKIIKTSTYITNEKNSNMLKGAAIAIPTVFVVASVVVFIKRKD